MLVKPHGAARLELLGSTKKRRLYTVRFLEWFVTVASSRPGRQASNTLMLCLNFAGIKTAACLRITMFSSSRRRGPQ